MAIWGDPLSILGPCAESKKLWQLIPPSTAWSALANTLKTGRLGTCCHSPAMLPDTSPQWKALLLPKNFWTVMAIYSLALWRIFLQWRWKRVVSPPQFYMVLHSFMRWSVRCGHKSRWHQSWRKQALKTGGAPHHTGPHRKGTRVIRRQEWGEGLVLDL